MSSNSLSKQLKPDLRSSPSVLFRKGITFGSIRVATFVLLDAISLLLAWQLAIIHGTKMISPWTATSNSFFPLLIVTVGIGVFSARGLYKPGKYRRDYFAIAKALSLVSLLLLLIAFLYDPKQYVSRSSFLLFWCFSILFICISRIVVDGIVNQLRRRGAIRHAVFLISDPEYRDRNIRFIEQQSCYKLLTTVDSQALDRSNREATFDTLSQLGVSEVFVSWSAIRNRLYLCWRFRAIGVTLRILPTELDFFLPGLGFDLIGDTSSPVIRTPLIAGGDYWVKRLFDFWFAVLLLVLFLPLYILIALLIKIDSPGPVFFRQIRVGLHGQRFKVWKFRTMVANAEQLQAALEIKNEMKDGVLFKLKDDPRITRIGKFLRRYSLDELPQVFNVLMGEMSFVGPRPLPVRDVQRFREKYFIRQEVLPGITGLWQVSGRSNIDNFEDAVNLDIAYICGWSLQLDLKIILQTVQVIFRKTGAY